MTKERTTHALLAVVVALLGLHLALRLSPREAAAQEPELSVEPQPPVRITHIAASSDSRTEIRAHLFRLWSDGTIEQNIQFPGGPTDLWTGWAVVPELP